MELTEICEYYRKQWRTRQSQIDRNAISIDPYNHFVGKLKQSELAKGWRGKNWKLGEEKCSGTLRVVAVKLDAKTLARSGWRRAEPCGRSYGDCSAAFAGFGTWKRAIQANVWLTMILKITVPPHACILSSGSRAAQKVSRILNNSFDVGQNVIKATWHLSRVLKRQANIARHWSEKLLKTRPYGFSLGLRHGVTKSLQRSQGWAIHPSCVERITVHSILAADFRPLLVEVVIEKVRHMAPRDFRHFTRKFTVTRVK